MDENSNEEVRAILAGYAREKRWLIPILEDVQRKLGYVPEDTVGLIGDHVRLSKSDVFGVLTFFAFFRMSPTGRNQIMVCRGTACHVRGAPRVLDAIERELGIQEGETTADRAFTLETVACIGACALAPTMTMNQEVHGRLTSQKALKILKDRVREGVA